MNASELTELKRGNILQLLNVKLVVVHNIIDDKIESIDLIGIGQTQASILAYNKVLLTKEWLLRFGLKIDYGFGYKFLNSHIVKAGQSFMITINNKDYILAYVHQLQNLHFSLKGEELQITKQE